MKDIQLPPDDVLWLRGNGAEIPMSQMNAGHLIAAYHKQKRIVANIESQRPMATQVEYGGFGTKEQRLQIWTEANAAWEKDYAEAKQMLDALEHHLSHRGFSPNDVICPYCNQKAELITNADHYRNPKIRGNRWVCKPCDASVGCHGETEIPLGNLADAPLRAARKRAHDVFDPLWDQDNSPMNRSEAYVWLAEAMDRRRVNISKITLDECEQVIAIMKEYWRQVRERNQ